MRVLFCIFLLLITGLSFSQEYDSLYLATKKNGITKLSVLSTHPFGIFISRQQGNFKIHPSKKTTARISIESGNVWGTPIKTYIPNDEATRNEAKNHIWHQAQYYFDEEDLNAKSFELQIDGVIKGLRANFDFKLAKEHELSISTRFFMLTNGKYPFSIFTNDEFIEYFHSNIGGGEDPFDRKVFGLGNANISYLDRNGNEMILNNGDFLFGGIETSYYYYPENMTNNAKNLRFNFGAHLGTNVSKYNTSMDFGLTSNVIKTISLNKTSNLQIGLSLGGIAKNAIDFKEDNLDFGTNDILAYLESVIEFNFVNKKGTILSFGADFYVQTPLNKISERDYIIPIRHPEAHKAWGHGVMNLYEFNDYWTFMFSITRKNTLTLYIQQDFTVSNNPDIQTGVGYMFEL